MAELSVMVEGSGVVSVPSLVPEGWAVEFINWARRMRVDDLRALCGTERQAIEVLEVCELVADAFQCTGVADGEPLP